MSSAGSFFEKNSAPPMEALFLAQENIRPYRTEHPLAAKIVIQSTYMDDWLDSVEGEVKGIHLSSTK